MRRSSEAVERVGAILAAASLPVTVTISCSFGCPFEGEVDPGAVADLCERLAAAASSSSRTRSASRRHGAYGDSSERVAILGRPVGAHLHNTRNTGYASAWAALEGGAEVLDASVGGLGGCPFSPNATGNVATEDLVWQLERDGVRTGVDLDALVETVRWLAGLLGRDLEGQLYRAAPGRREPRHASTVPREPARARDVSVPAPARGESRRLVPLGRRGARRRPRPRRADPALDRLRGLPLVPRDGARVVRGWRRPPS